MSKTRNNVPKRKKNVSTQEDKIAAFYTQNNSSGNGNKASGKRKDQSAKIKEQRSE